MARFVKPLGQQNDGPQGPRSSAMRFKASVYLTSVLTSVALVAAPMAAQAGGMSRIGTYGGHKGMQGPNCKPGFGGGNRTVNIYKPTNIQNNISVYKPVTVNKNVNVYKPITIDKSINVYKPITINKNVEINKNIDITKNIDNSKYIDNSKNININKNIVINKGGGEAEALAVAAAFAQASASAQVNISNMSGGVSYVSSGSYVEAPPSYAGGDLGNISVQPQCVWRDATVVKAVRALCVSADGREFPAAHMTGETWINGAYEGELARCLPGSVLKVVLGKVSQSNQGMAGAFEGAETIQCRPHEALRHYKGGVLKCAPAVKVVDCTERTNLRKWGTGDMFVSFQQRVCVDVDSREYSQVMSRDPQAGRY
jgi:hypothetical protein